MVRKQLSDYSEEERRVMRECTQDAFWYRAMPSATVAGASMYWAVRAGKLKSVANSRFRTWSVVAGFSSLAYVVAKISYVLGENCIKKFLTQAPISDISKHIRKKRNISKADVISDSVENTLEPVKLLEIADSKDFDEMVRKQLSNYSEEEHRVMRECTQDAFWYRAMPSATVAGASMYWAVRAGKLKSVANSRFRTWSVVAGFSSLAYVVANISYVLSENCLKKFLTQAPDSDISKKIRKKLNISKADVISDSVENTLEPVKLLEIVDSKDFDERKMTEKEQQILVDCNSAAFYQYSLPTMVVASATAYASVARILRLQNRSRMAQSAPVAFACVWGYFMGQVMYLYSTDCADRFVKYAPEGSIAKKLQQHLHEPQEYEMCEGCQTVAVLENDRDEYVIPASNEQSLKKLVTDTPASPTKQAPRPVEGSESSQK